MSFHGTSLVVGVMNVNEGEYLLDHPFPQNALGREEKLKIDRLTTHCSPKAEKTESCTAFCFK